MNAEACHQASPRETVKSIVLTVLGAKRVADWCGVTEGAVYQWLSRATDAEPFPVKRVPTVLTAARRDGVAFDAAPFMAMLGLSEARP